MAKSAASTLAAVLLVTLVPSVVGHGYIVEPPARNVIFHGPRNAYCPHCGNGGGVCGDGGQWPASSNYLGGENKGPQRTYTAGQLVEFEVTLTAHHKGHFELHICDEHLGPLTPDPEGPSGCLSRWVLQRVPPESPDAVYSDCRVNDPRDDCQPLDQDHPERWYLSPGSGTKKMHFRIPTGLSCSSCTLQWRWWTANSCIPADGYGCYFQRMGALGWDAMAWCGAGCGTCRSSLLQSNASQASSSSSAREGCGEEFRNCADITVLALGGAPSPSPTPSPSPQPSPAPSTTAAPTPAPSTTTASPASPMPAPPGSSAPETCVPQSVLTCINDYSGYWPKCAPGQSKSNAGPGGYEFGYYCSQEWTDALNEVLSDPVVNKCRDPQAIQQFLAQVAYETGYYSTVYQPLDGGAGLIHMIPGNWVPNAQDMDALWPGNDYAGKAADMGKNFFQTADYGWRSVAAWFKRTNRVIGGCGKDLFDQSYDEQTRCILSRVVDRQEAYDVVGRCMAQAPTTQAPTTTATTATTQSTATTTQATTQSTATTTEPEPKPESTTPEQEPTTTTKPAGPVSCVQNTDCATNAWCKDASYVDWCPAQGEWCPSPQCIMSIPATTPSPTTPAPTTPASTTQPTTTQAPTTQAPTTQATTTTQAPTTQATTTTQTTTTLPPTTQATTQSTATTTEPEPEPSTTTARETTSTAKPGPVSCVQNTDCATNAWCKDASYVAWCPAQGEWCPSPQCVMVMPASSHEPRVARKRASAHPHGFLAPALIQAMAWLERAVGIDETAAEL